MSLESRLGDLATAVGLDIKALSEGGGTKISALSAASTLDGTEMLAVVQGGSTKKVTSDQIKTHAHSSRHFIRADVDRNLPNDTNLNALFNNPTNGRLTLTTGVYLFRGMFIVTAMSATSGNAQIDLLGAGTATIGSWMWCLSGIDNSTPAAIDKADLTPYFQVANTAASAVTAGTGTAMRFNVEGSFEVTSGGTFIPSIDQVTAAAAVVQDGSFFMAERIGDSGLVSIGSWD